MKTLIIVNLLFAASLASARGGSVSGGDGGHGIFCPRARGHRVQLLDLFEGRNAYGVHFEFGTPPFTADQGEVLHLAIHKAQRRFADVIPGDREAGQLFHVFQTFDEGPKDVLRFDEELPSTVDHGPLKVETPQGCSLVQLGYAVRTDDRHLAIHVNARAWDSLSKTDQAALLIHEAFHPYFPNRDTVALRQFVMYLGADKKFRSRNADLFRRLVETRRAIKAFR